MIGVSAIAGMAYGTLVGGFLQFAVQWPSLRRAGFRFRPKLSISDPGVRQILRLLGPAIIGTAAVQINVFINTNFASAIIDPGYRNHRQRSGVVAKLRVSLYAVSHRRFWRGHRHRNSADASAKLEPAGLPRISPNPRPFTDSGISPVHSIGARARRIGRPIIALIFEHGKFTSFDTVQTANALAAYSLGLAGYAAIKVLSPAFYALQDARTPMLISLGSILVNFVLNSLLVGTFGHVGLAFSTSSVALVNFILLAFLMRRRLGGMEGRRLGLALLRIFAAALPMAACAWLVSELAATLPLHELARRLVQVSAALGAAAVVFYLGCRWFGVAELTEAADAITGKFARILRRK